MLLAVQGFGAEKVTMKRFAFSPPMGGTTITVTVTGDWLGWDPKGAPLSLQPDGSFSAEVPVPDGRHLYKFVVGGKSWYPDTTNPNREPDTYGGFNSVLVVGDEKVPAPSASKPAVPGAPITFEVKDLPPDFKEAWIPVRYETGSLHFDPSKEAKSQLLLSSKPWALPATSKKDTSTTTPFIARQIFVWLPKALKEKPKSRLPVIYLHDGQNVWDDMSCCFGHGGWCLNTTMDEMTTLTPAILVGIPNSPARMWDYGLGEDIVNLKDTPYLKFLRDVVKPRIDKEFPTLSDPTHTTVMGSSMGGVISLFAAYRNPEVFGNAVAMSTAFQVPDTRGQRLLDLLEKKGRGKFRLYLDSGTGNGMAGAGMSNDGAPLTRKFAESAEGAGWKPQVDFLHFEDAGAEHNEKAWRNRGWRALQFVLKPANKKSAK